MVQKTINKLVELMAQEKLIEEEQREAFSYTYLFWTEKLLTVGSLCVIGMGLRNLINTIFFLLFFLVLRKRTGGFHANSFLGCYAGSVGLYLAVVLSSGIWIQHMLLLGIMLCFSILAIEVIGTVNHPNMDMSGEELRESKRAARIIAILEGAAILFLTYAGIDRVTIGYMAMGMIICAFLLCIAKIIKQEVKGNEQI
ncbi:MAG: accessory gene regulator B family protein [Lachnospiraceae bacterium]